MRRVALGDIATVSGRSAGRATVLPVYSVTKHRGFVPSLEYFKKQVFSRELADYTVVEPGEFAYATIHLDEGSIGIAPEQCLISPMYTSFKVADQVVDARYLVRFLKSPIALEQYPRLGKGTIPRRRAISFGRLSTLEVPLPPLAEQRRIAEILDRADALRAKRRTALALLDTLTRSIFVEMFGDPLASSNRWPQGRLSSLGALDRGVSKHRPRNAPELLGGPYPLIQTGDVANSGGYIRQCASTYSEVGLEQSRMWPAGTLCITIAANIAKTGILTFDACFPDSVVGFCANVETVEYVRAWLGFMQESLENAAPESAQKNINLKVLRNLELPLPSSDLRMAFAKRVAAVEDVKASHRASLAQLEALFASLQYRAFRGEL